MPPATSQSLTDGVGRSCHWADNMIPDSSEAVSFPCSQPRHPLGGRGRRISSHMSAACQKHTSVCRGRWGTKDRWAQLQPVFRTPSSWVPCGPGIKPVKSPDTEVTLYFSKIEAASFPLSWTGLNCKTCPSSNSIWGFHCYSCSQSLLWKIHCKCFFPFSLSRNRVEWLAFRFPSLISETLKSARPKFPFLFFSPSQSLSAFLKGCKLITAWEVIYMAIPFLETNRTWLEHYSTTQTECAWKRRYV